MNRLENLPVDIKKIINRKVEDIHIVERRIERKKNRGENRLMKHKKEVKTKFIELVLTYFREKSNDIFFNLVEEKISKEIVNKCHRNGVVCMELMSKYTLSTVFTKKYFEIFCEKLHRPQRFYNCNTFEDRINFLQSNTK